MIKSGGGRSPPGSAWRYANTNYLLAAIAVERASGQSLPDFAHDRIFVPLKMRESAYVTSASDIRKSRAIPYQANDDGTFSAAHYAAHPGPTGVQTNVVDLERWAENFYLPKVGDVDVLAQMQAPGALDDGTPIDFAMGLEHKRLGEHDAILHTGVTVGTRAAFVRFPAHEVTIALLCNRMDVNTERIATQIADVLFN